MKEKKLKLKLDDIKVESFVTSLDDREKNGLVGASTLPTGCYKTDCTCGINCPVSQYCASQGSCSYPCC